MERGGDEKRIGEESRRGSREKNGIRRRKGGGDETTIGRDARKLRTHALTHEQLAFINTVYKSYLKRQNRI